MRGRRSLPALAAALVLAAACRPGKPPAPDVVARIGETEVHYSEFESYLARTAGDGESVLASEVLSQIFDQFLDEELLVRLAVDRGLTRASGAGSAGARRRAIDELLRSDLKAQPGEPEIAAYYQAHRDEFARPERVRLRQILTEDRAAAEKALRELAAGADFGAIADRLSRDPGSASGGTGGYQGELSRQDLPPAFADIIFALQPGEVSRLVPADYGFHIFQVISRSPSEVVPLAAARAEIAERLREQRADRLLAELVRDARRRYNVELYERNLPFEYRGSYSHAPKTP